MGGTNSHEVCHTTPPRDEKSRKLLPFDPRSPSTDITRTPILVEKTPEGALDPWLDPRSPTAGIYRTPLTNMTDEKQGLFYLLIFIMKCLYPTVTDGWYL